MPKNILFEVTPRNPATGLLVSPPLRMSMSGGTSADVIPAGQSDQWLPVLTNGPTRKIEYFGSGQVTEVQISHGNIEFRQHSDLGNLHWSNYSFDGALARVFVGDSGAAGHDRRSRHAGSLSTLRHGLGWAAAYRLCTLLAVFVPRTGSSGPEYPATTG